MNKNLLKSKMVLHGETAKCLCEALGITEQSFSQKINNSTGGQFTQREIKIIMERYSLTDSEIKDIFFAADGLNKGAVAPTPTTQTNKE